MNGYDRTFNNNEMNEYEKKIKDNSLISFHVDDDKQLKKHKSIWINIEDLKGIKLAALSIFNEKFIKTKLRKNINKGFYRFPCLGCARTLSRMSVLYNNFYQFFTCLQEQMY